MKYITIESEGLLISPEVLQKIAVGEAEGQKPADFGLDKKTRLTDEIAACWSDALAFWEAFQHSVSRLKETDSAATPTREQWILPLLRSLGWDKLSYMKSAAQVGGQTYAISHREGGDSGIPVHIEGARVGLDSRPPSGTPRISPQSLLQEYLNRTEHLWAIVTNGYRLRILRDSSRMSRPTYLEFDLQQMMQGEHFAEFQLFYKLIHRSRWPASMEAAPACLLERYYQQSIEEGGRVRDGLRDGVEEALKIFGNGFLQYPDNAELVSKIKAGKLTPELYYQELLRLVYRFLFLMVSEERKLVGPDSKDELHHKVYHSFYSIRHLREKVERHFNQHDRHWDIWEGMRQTFSFYSSPSAAGKIGMSALNGGLFTNIAMPDLENARMYNRDFLRGFAQLSLFKDERIVRPINYSHLDVEEIGSVYESLLDFHPLIVERDGRLEFELAWGTERKSTGSYYTRPELVQELIKSALVPVIEERLAAAKTKEEKEKALLSLRVCDPASGSGHFLLAAARRIGKELARVRTGEEYPPPEKVRPAVRDVIRHCVYGVDVNPLAVDLCKVALWLEGHDSGMPLTFLDHRVKCGNSLVGVDSIERLKAGIPDEAFKPVTGDGKEASRMLKAQNKKEREKLKSGQAPLMLEARGMLEADLEIFAGQAEKLDAIVEDEVEDIRKKQAVYGSLQAGEAWLRDWYACNIWTAAFYYPLVDPGDPTVPTQGKLIQYINNPKACDARLAGNAAGLAVKHRFFNWPLEFPEVAKARGFDVVLSNPPWERIKLEEKEFFAMRDPEIAAAPNKAAREKLIKALDNKNPALMHEFEEAKHDAEAESRFVRAGGRFPLTAVGDINMYALFAELARSLLSQKGRAGIIVPTGIVTDDTCKYFSSDLSKQRQLATLYDFENREALFPGVHRSYKFCLLTVAAGGGVRSSQFAFFLTRTAHLDEEIRRFELSPEDIALINPNTRTMPIFRTKVDAELTKQAYKRVPVLENEGKGENPWGIHFMRMFDMSNDSHLFSTEPQPRYQRLYEDWMVHQYDHRFQSDGNYQPSIEDRNNPHWTVKPRYWIDKTEIESRLTGTTDKGYLLVFRNRTRSTDIRTAIFTMIPRTGAGNPIPVIHVRAENDRICCLLANLNSLILDYVLQQKIGGLNLNFFIVKQLAVLAPNIYTEKDIQLIKNHVLELVYTAYDLKPFAEDMGYHGEPFKWDEDRRALLKAELDAYYAHLYGLTRDELRYILDPQDIYGPDFPGETFRVLKEKETKVYGEYRTRRLVLEAWDRLFGKGGGI
jgi:hypothetical protein